MTTCHRLRALLATSALAAAAVLPGPAHAQLGRETQSCSVPLPPDEAFELLRALSNGGTTSRFGSGGVTSGTELIVNQFKGDRSAWTVIAQVKPQFAFQGPFAALSSENGLALGPIALGLVYDAATGVLAATTESQIATLFPFDVDPKPIRFKDSTATSVIKAGSGLSAGVTRSMLGPEYAALGDRNADVSVVLDYFEDRKRGSRRIDALAKIPADLRTILACDPRFGAVNVGHQLVLASELELERRAGVDGAGQPIVDQTLRLNGTVVESVRIADVASDDLQGSFRVSLGGDGLYSAVILAPWLISDDGKLSVQHNANLTLKFSGADRALVEPASIAFTMVDFCTAGRRC
jgi:hypothetical protein